MRAADYRRSYEVLQRISVFMSSIHRLEELLKLIMEESRRILEAEASSLLLYDPRRRVLSFKVATGARGNAVRTIELKYGQGIAGTCARSRKTINIPDVSRDARFFAAADRHSRFQTRSILAVPLVGRGNRLVGVLEVLNRLDRQPFDRQDEEMMEIIAVQATLAIENARLYRDNVRRARLAGAGETMLSLSHDIRNILNGLCGGADLLEATLAEHPDNCAREAWGIVRENVGQISDLILDMLNYAVKKEPAFEPVNLPEFIRGTLGVYREKVAAKKVCLEYRLDPALDSVSLDPSGMRRVLLNLFGNAFEIVAPGSGRITITTRQPAQPGVYEVVVADNGPGIPPENMGRIFDLFFSTRGHQGTGLGLPVVRKIVNEHRGRVTVASEPGRGTAFTLSLPGQPPVRA